MARNHPVTGPYPDGDSRNITLTPSDTSIEPPRTGPREPMPDDARARAEREARGDEEVPGTPMTELPTHQLQPGGPVTTQTSSVRGGPGAAGEAPPQSSEIGLGDISGAQARATLGMAGDNPPARARADAAHPLGRN
ncbi:MAG: hypothetical protein V2I27_12455 [Erythrobacter sp.]|jgi:hypothetical protein|nr:hypothetical protein [Erythrobacter sp.]